MALFERRTLQDYTNSLADYLPGGALFQSKNDAGSNLRGLLSGLAGELFRANGFLREYSCDVLPDETSKFLSEWESALGIPDECFPGNGTDAERRRDILAKLAALGVQTVDDFEELADLYDIDVIVTPGEDSPFPSAVPKFTIVITWFANVPEQAEQIQIVSCLFEKLKPANVELVFVNLNQYAQAGEAAMQCGESFAQCDNRLF